MVFTSCFSNRKRAIALTLVIVGHWIFPDPFPKPSTWIASFPQHKTCYVFSNKSKCCPASVRISHAPCQQHIFDSHFATGPWQVHSSGAAAKGSLLTAFLLVLIVSLHCLFQAHTHTTFQQLTFAHTGTGRAFCCFFVGFFFSQHRLLNSKALRCSTGWLLSPFLSGDARISFRPLTWIFCLCSSSAWFRFLSSLPPSSSREVLPSTPWNVIIRKCCHYSQMLQTVRRGCTGVWCVRRCCANTQIPVPHELPWSLREHQVPAAGAADASSIEDCNFPELLPFLFIFSPTLLCREPPWLILCVLFFPPFSVCSHNQPAALCWSIPWSSFLLCLAEAALFSRLNYPLCFSPLLGIIGSSWCSLWKP